MPTPLPSSFASAAAGNVHDPNKRGDGTAASEWYALFCLPCSAFVVAIIFFCIFVLHWPFQAVLVYADFLLHCCMVLTELFYILVLFRKFVSA